MSNPEARSLELSVEEFAALPAEDGYRLELSRGRLVREPAPGLRHSGLAGKIYRLLWSCGDEGRRGQPFFDAGFLLTADPPTVRVPDVAFLRSERIPEGGLPERFGEGAPDLAVEILSSSDSASGMQRKALDYLDAGAELVWVVDPSEQTVTVYRSPGDIRILSAGDALEDSAILGDARIPVRELFE